MNKNTQTAEKIAEQIIYNLDAYATNYDNYEYGLPVHGDHMQNMINIVEPVLQLYRQQGECIIHSLDKQGKCFKCTPQQGEKQSTEAEAEEMLRNPLTFEQAKAQVRRLNGEATLPTGKKNRAIEIMMKHCTDNGLLPMGLGKSILAAMEEYASQPKQGEVEAVKWVSVNDRLPTKEDGDENGKVLIYRETNPDQKGLTVAIYDWSMVKYSENAYWMPLPNPPTP